MIEQKVIFHRLKFREKRVLNLDRHKESCATKAEVTRECHLLISGVSEWAPSVIYQISMLGSYRILVGMEKNRKFS